MVTICFQGHTVVLQKRDGASYQGIFHTAKVDKGGFQVVLKMARRLVSNPRYTVDVGFCLIVLLQTAEGVPTKDATETVFRVAATEMKSVRSCYERGYL